MAFAWPGAEIAVMGPEGAVAVLFKKDLEEVEGMQSRRDALIRSYRDELANPYVAASRGYVDDVIQVSESRARIIAALSVLRNKREAAPKRKHGNIPL